MKIELTLVLAFQLIFTSIVWTQNPATSFEEIISEHFSDSAPGAAILVQKGNKTLYKTAVGLSDLETAQKIKADDIFRIASITKQFTAAAILRLADEGKLDLEDSIDKYVEGLTTSHRPVLIKHLLSHTSGIKNYTDIPSWDSETNVPKLTTKDVVDIFKNEALAFEPGERYSYSNLGYYLLGHIIEVISGDTYSHYLDKTFFKPLNMKHSGYEDQNEISLNRIKGFSKNDGSFSLAEELDMKLAFAAGALVSTTEDLSKWTTAVFSNEVLTKENLNLAHSKFELNNGTYIPYGFGWEIGEIRGQKTIKHDGIINGFISFGLYLPETEVFVAVLTNCDCTQQIEEVSSKLAALAIGQPYVFDNVAYLKSDLIALQGSYQSPTGETQSIGLQDGQLYIYGRGGAKSFLKYLSKDELVIENSLTFLQFQRNDNQQVKSFQKVDFDYQTNWKLLANDVQELESIKITKENFNQYVGKYKVEGAFTFDVYYEEGKMYGSVQGDIKEILAYGKDKFFTKNSDIKLEFIRNEQNVIHQVKLFLPVEMKANRIEWSIPKRS